MNAPFVNNLAERNEIFQRIVNFLMEHPTTSDMNMEQLQRVSRADKAKLEPVLKAMHKKGNIGRYVLGRKGNQNRFEFNYKPEDIVNASIDPDYSADPIRKRTVNDAGKVVPATDTRERHLTIRTTKDGVEIHMSKGVVIDSQSLASILKQLQ